MLHIDENLLEIDTEIDKIVTELVKSDEARHLRVARVSFLADDLLQDEIQFLNQNLEFIKYRKDLQELQKKINLNEKVYQLKLAENDFQQVLSDLTRTLTMSISEYILIDENLPLRGGTHHQRQKFE